MLDKNTKKVFEQEISSENVNGKLTSDSFNIYTKLQNPKQRFNIRIFLVYLLITSLLVASAVIFASTIKTAYFNKGSETEKDNNINKIRTTYQNSSNLKVETITPELSELFDIPVGVKIIEIENNNPLFNGLKPNDIIVGISGKPIENITQFDTEVAMLGNEIFLTYNIYRNGAFKDIAPFELDS